MSGEIAHQWLGSPVHPGIREQCAEECQLLEETDNRILFRTSETVEGGRRDCQFAGHRGVAAKRGRWQVARRAGAGFTTAGNDAGWAHPVVSSGVATQIPVIGDQGFPCLPVQ